MMVALTTLKMIQYFGTDVRRINHALKVFSYAKTIGEMEGLSLPMQKVLELAAILHDIGIKEAERKYNASTGKYQEIEGPYVARELLFEMPIEVLELERICFLIGHHHTYACIDGIDFQILVEADFLVNIYEDQMNEQQIKSICEKYFKTTTGIEMLKSCYPENPEKTY